MAQKRYYSLRELYRKHSIFLKEKVGVYNNSEYNRALFGLRQYFEWLQKKVLTIYAAGAVHLREYFSWLVAAPGIRSELLTRMILQRRKMALYNFYGWLIEQKILDENPFSKPLRQELTEFLHHSRDGPPPAPRWPGQAPEIFRGLYELTQKMDKARGYHPTTCAVHRRGWRIFFEWMVRRGLQSIEQVTERELIEYQDYLLQRQEEKGGYQLSALTRLRHLCAVKLLFEYLRLSLLVKHDPTHVIELPKCGKGLPHVLMSRHEVEKMLSLPDITTPMGIRDRTIMEVFYSTGMRLNELCHLKDEDISFQEGMVRVLVPKGGVSKQRVVAIGREALEWVRRYIEGARPQIVGREKPQYLFVNSNGTPVHKWNLGKVMAHYRLKGGFKKQITTHSFRVTCATEMLRNRADLRYVQAQLGHSSIQSTQLYARVLPNDLKKVHQRTHPRERRRSSVIACEETSLKTIP